MRAPVLLLKLGTTVPSVLARRGDFEQWIALRAGVDPSRFEVVDARAGGDLPDPAAFAGIVLTGSSAMVTDREPWSERVAGWLPGAVAAGTPLLGICYGHQLLARALGGRVARNPRGREIGTVRVALSAAACDDALFGGLPDVLRVQATHVESVVDLPPGARRLAYNDADPNQAFAVGRAAWGVQFHPELDADILRGYVATRRAAIVAEGIDADAIARDARDADDGAALLRRFAAIASGRKN